MLSKRPHQSAGQDQSSGKSIELERWERKEQKLLENIKAVQDNPGMQNAAWVEGQTRYFRQLLSNHRKAKPAR